MEKSARFRKRPLHNLSGNWILEISLEGEVRAELLERANLKRGKWGVCRLEERHAGVAGELGGIKEN